MKCPEEGVLRAFVDRELADELSELLQRHLATCQECRDSFTRLEQNATLVKSRLDAALAPGTMPLPDPHRALARLESSLLTSKSIWDRIREGGYRAMSPFQNTAARAAMAALAACLCLVVLLAFEPVRSAAEDFLGVFRAERFAVVTVDLNNPPDVPNPSELGTLTVPEQPKVHQVTSKAEAQALVDFALADLPEALVESASYNVSEGVQFSFTFDAQKVKAYLASRGISSMVLPKNLDGATLKVDVPPIVTVGVDLTPADGTAPRRHVTFVQTTSPTLEVPPDLDVELIRAQLLNSGLLPPDLASQLAAIQDWRRTAIIPVPSEGVTKRDVDVAGAPGLLIAGPEFGAGVFWQRAPIIYGLTTYTGLSAEDLLSIARSIK